MTAEEKRINFPPLTTYQRDVDLLLNMLSSVIERRAAVYVSAPITSGRRFADWSSSQSQDFNLSHPDTYREFRRAVLEPNSAHARVIITDLRARFNKVVIDPTALADIDGWTQDDYRYLWARVITSYADTVVFLNGWQYSNGCAYEFLIAHQIYPRPAILTESLDHLTLEAGTALVASAIPELQSSGSAVDFLRQVLNELTKVSDVEVLAQA